MTTERTREVVESVATVILVFGLVWLLPEVVVTVVIYGALLIVAVMLYLMIRRRDGRGCEARR